MLNNMLKKIKLSTVVSALFLGFAIFYFSVAMGLRYWSSGYAPGPGFIPRWTSGLLIILSLIALINSFKEPGVVLSDILPKDRVGRINLFVTWGALFFLLIFTQPLGFITASTISLTAMFSRGTTLPKAALISLVLTLICFYIFRVLLQMQIPVNQFGF